MHGGRVCIHKRAWTRFSQQLTFTLTPQRSTLLALFTSHYFCHFFAAVCGDLWPYFSRGFVGFFFLCVICLLGLHRGSRVSGYLFDVGVFLAVSCFYSWTKKGNGKNLRVFLTRLPQRCLESGHNLCGEFNPVCRRAWGWSDKLSIRLPENFLTCHSKEKVSPRITVIFCIHRNRRNRVTGRTLTCPGDGNMEARFRRKKRELKLELKNQGRDALDYISEGRKGQIAVLFSSEDTVQHQDASQRDRVFKSIDQQEAGVNTNVVWGGAVDSHVCLQLRTVCKNKTLEDICKLILLCITHYSYKQKIGRKSKKNQLGL